MSYTPKLLGWIRQNGGRALRDKGMEKVLDHTAADWRKWYASTVNNWFGTLRKGETFTGETLRIIAVQYGLEEPHHPNAWSANAASVIRDWFKNNRIEETGTLEHAGLRSARARRCVQYRKIR